MDENEYEMWHWGSTAILISFLWVVLIYDFASPWINFLCASFISMLWSGTCVWAYKLYLEENGYKIVKEES